jgi:hypothetical protein
VSSENRETLPGGIHALSRVPFRSHTKTTSRPAIVPCLPWPRTCRVVGLAKAETRHAFRVATAEVRRFLEEFTFKSARERLSKAFQLVSPEIWADCE